MLSYKIRSTHFIYSWNFFALGTLGPCAVVVAFGFLRCHHVLHAVIMLVCAHAFTGFAHSGFLSNHLDLCPRYAGITLGLAQTVGEFRFLSRITRYMVLLMNCTCYKHHCMCVYYRRNIYSIFSRTSEIHFQKILRKWFLKYVLIRR